MIEYYYTIIQRSITYHLFQEHLTIEEIAKRRDLAISTIENHLLQCADHGLDLDFLRLIPNEYIPLLEKAVQEAGRERLKPIKELLPEEISYFMIKAYLQFLSKK